MTPKQAHELDAINNALILVRDRYKKELLKHTELERKFNKSCQQLNRLRERALELEAKQSIACAAIHGGSSSQASEASTCADGGMANE
jgi:hypothetical protein